MTLRQSGPDYVAPVLSRNIEKLTRVRKHSDAGRSIQAKLADRITRFAGSMACVYFHVGLFGLWLLVNTANIPGFKHFDPYPFSMLAMYASVEAIFLSTFILISQNRMSKLEEKRADLDLQISLLAEHEITRLIQMVELLAKKSGIQTENTVGDLSQLKKDVDPETVLNELEKTERNI